MIRLRLGYARFVTLCLVMVIFASSLGMYAPGHAEATQSMSNTSAHAMPHMDESAAGCPSEGVASVGLGDGHADCAMTICCFAAINDRHHMHVAHVLRAEYGRRADSRLRQAVPERSDKPPRHT